MGKRFQYAKIVCILVWPFYMVCYIECMSFTQLEFYLFTMFMCQVRIIVYPFVYEIDESDDNQAFLSYKHLYIIDQSELFLSFLK